MKSTDSNSHTLGFNWRIISIIHNPLAGWVVLGLSLTITIIAYKVSSRLAESQALTRFEYRSAEIITAIDKRLSEYEQVLRSGVAMIYSQENVTRQEWEKFAATLSLENYWPGIQGLGFAIPLKPTELQSHTDSIKAEGFADYSVRPPGQRDLYTAIVYLEPFDWRNKRAFGYDMWSNEIRREAMARAMDSGDAATSGKITLVQETDTDVQSGFLTYLPVYSSKQLPETLEQRQQQLKGWVYAAFRAGDLMAGIIGEADPSIEFEIYDGEQVGEEYLLFDSNNSPHFFDQNHLPTFSHSKTLKLQGRPWTIYLNTPTVGPNAVSVDQPKYILFGGIIIDILLFYVIVSLYSINKKAEHIAENLTVEHRHATEREAKANRAKSQFLANMSHELRTPLNSIIGFTKILQRKLGGNIEEKELEALNTVGRNGKHLLGLINDILDLSKVEAGKMEVDVGEFELISSLENDITEWEHKANSKGLAFIARIEQSAIPMKTDQRKIHQAIKNLMTNAVKYTDVGRIELIISYQQADSTDVCIKVLDTGIGISSEDQGRLFHQYFRADSVRKEALEGTGLGLLITANFIELLGGGISIKSELGKGSHFEIIVPCFYQENQGYHDPVASRGLEDDMNAA